VSCVWSKRYKETCKKAASSPPFLLHSRRPLTEAEQAEARDARAHAAAAAEARAKAHEASPYGRAIKKADADARKPSASGGGGAQASDWLS
jgi:hypothetical protein